MQELDTLLDLLGRPEFLAGLLAGAIALVGLFATSELGLKHAWGLAVSIATVVAIHATIGRRLGFALGIGLLAAGGWWLGRLDEGEESSRPGAWLVIVAGAWLAATRGDVAPSQWLVLASIGVALGAGYAMSRWGEDDRSDLIGPLFLITAFGIWTTVPETEAARALLGASIPLAIATRPWLGAKLGSAGGFALAGVVVWVAATGGAERTASIVGAWGTLGLLVLYPLMKAYLENTPTWLIASGHALIVLITARGIGLREDAGPALVLTTALYVLIVFVIRIMGPRMGSEGPVEEQAWK